MTRIHSANRERGASGLEATLMLPVFLFTVIGILDCAQFLFFHQAIAYRAAAAVRYSAVQNYDTAAIKNYIVYEQLSSTITDSATPLLNLTPDKVSVVKLDTGTNNSRVLITVSDYSFWVFSPLIAAIGQGQPIQVCMPIEEP